MSRLWSLSIAVALVAAACGSGAAITDDPFELVGVIVTATVGDTPDELDGEREDEETSSPSPAAGDVASPSEPGAASVTVESFSGPLDDCDIAEGRIAEVFYGADTAFEPAGVVEDPAFPVNLDEVRVHIEGIVLQQTSDDEVEACVLVAEQVRVLEPGSSPSPGAPTTAPGEPGATEGPGVTPTSSPTSTPPTATPPTASPEETDEPSETTEPPSTDAPTASPDST